MADLNPLIRVRRHVVEQKQKMLAELYRQAEELEGVAALDQAEALIDEALQLDRADLGAVLLELRAALRLLVGVEITLDAADLAVEQVDEGPEQVVEIVLEPRVGQHGGKAVDDRGEAFSPA